MSTTRAVSASLPAVPPDGGMNRYFREIWKFPILDADEEYMLAQRFRSHGDAEAAHRLVTSHLRLVAKIAMKYKGYGLPVADLVSEGNIGLMKAVKKFEPERGFRLSTYAMWWIRASITEYVLRSWSMVRMGAMSAQKKLFFSLRSMKNRLRIMDSGELTPEDAAALSTAYGGSVGAEAIAAMNRRLAARDSSLNAPVGGEEDSGLSFQDMLVDGGPSPEAELAEAEEKSFRGGLLQAAVADLPERERRIFTERRLKDDPKTLEELGKVFGVSRERVRQLEVRAYDRVQTAVHKAAAEAQAAAAVQTARAAQAA
ncbi:MAG: RNA polymerase sigma factor RpoH [Rhodospirillales bacterium]